MISLNKNKKMFSQCERKAKQKQDKKITNNKQIFVKFDFIKWTSTSN